MKYNVVLLLTFIFLVGCNPGSEVKINTAGIFNPVLYSINNQDADGKTIDLGEHLLTEDPIPLTVRVYNKTEYPYTDLNIVMSADGDNSASVTFMPTPTGEIIFPGHQGTCGKVLSPGRTCEIRLQFAPREGRIYLETLALKFKNYVNPEEHIGKVTLIAGMPASLTFTSDKTQYTFGNLIGVSQVPVVERAEVTTYSEELEVINSGGLPAKSVTVNITESCTSSLTNLCPNGMGSAFAMENNCPTKLMPGEKCKIKVNFQPKNQDPTSGPVPDDIKDINYRSTVTMNFVKDPHGTTAALNGYFRSISTNIEARFRVAVNTLRFETPVVSGNRDVRSFRINNLGYREGQIRAIAVRDIGGSHIATCRAGASSTLLDCFDGSGALLPLANFPFTFNDKNECLSDVSEAAKYIDVGNGCVFEVIFQPSVTYLTDKPTEFQDLQPEVVFDSRWQGNEKIVTSKLFSLSASSLAAARLIPEKFRYDGLDYPVTGTTPGVVDMGRLPLQSLNFFNRKSVIISFKNIGSSPATNLVLKDGMNRSIPVGGASVSLGASIPYYYSTVVASESTCTIVNPGDTCTLTLMFAAIGMTTNAEEIANMFDAIGGDGKNYKGFLVKYNSGSKYSDTNRDQDPDYVVNPGELRVNAELVRKGMLVQLADDTRNINNIGNNINVVGDTIISHVYLQNIGTGTIPYIRLNTPPVYVNPSWNPDVTIVDTPDPASLGADFDCLDIADEDLTYTVPASATPDSRVGNFLDLPREKICVYTLQMKTADLRRNVNATTCSNVVPASTNLEEGSRFFSRALSGVDMWEFCNNAASQISANLNFQYYDGDATDPDLPPGSTYGKKINLNGYTYRATLSRTAKIIPYSFTPALTATLYRPEIVYSSISGTQPTRTVPETWFYGLASTFYKTVNDNAQTSPFIQGDESRNFVPTLAAFGNRANYDYVLYLGSFPQGSPNFNFPVSLKNLGGSQAKLTSFTVTPDANFTVLSKPSTFPANVNAGADVTPVNFRFTPSVAGEHQMEVEFTYENGRKLLPLIYKSSTSPSNLVAAGKEVVTQKILVLAHVQATGTHPLITMTAQDYTVTPNVGAPPTETLGASYPVNLSWNTAAVASTLVFDTIKLTAAPTIYDGYAKKVLTFTNNTAFPLTNFRPLYKVDTTGTASKIVPTTFKTVTGSTCTSGMTLAAGANCKIVLQYQPGSADTTDTFVLGSTYQMGTGQYVMQNVGISLLPRSPGNIIVSGVAQESINYKVTAGSSTVTRFSHPLNISNQILNTVPKPFIFDQTSGTFKKLQLVNQQATKTSLLLAYQKYLTAFSLRGYSAGSPAPSTVVPDPSEYRTFGGFDYAIIHKMTYGDGSDRVVIEASKGCLFGDDELNGAIPDHQKGFNNTTTTPCYALVSFYANFEYLKKAIVVTNGDDMRGTASELWYYSVNRTSTASMWLHIKGTINPDTSVASGSYGDVVTSDAKTVSFSTPKMTPSNGALGNVVGLRVLMSSSSTGLNDPYNTALSYFDIRPYDSMSAQYANFNTGLSNGQYFWFRTIAIRKDLRFVDSAPKRFVGLGAGEYLSATAATTTLKTLVPPVNHYYFHDKNILVEKSLANGIGYDSHAMATNRCTQKNVTLKNPGNVTYSYELINSNIWTDLVATPAATSYINMTQISHWVSDPLVSIDTKCAALPGFLPGMSSQTLESSYVFYIRNSTNPATNVNTAVGGVPGTSYSDYDSYIDGAIGYASARCMVVLPP